MQLTKRNFLKWITGGAAALLTPAAGLAFSIFREFGHSPVSEVLEQYKNLPYFVNGRFRGAEDLPFYPERVRGGGAGWARFILPNPHSPVSPLPKVGLDRSSFAVVPSDFAAYWLGHSALIIEMDGKRLLLDPVFGNAAPVPGIVRRYDAPPLQREDLPPLDYVLITHDHYDHLERSTMQALSNKTRFIVPLGVDRHLVGWGIPVDRITALGWGESYPQQSLVITAEPTVHFSGRTLADRDTTLWVSYVIKGHNHCVFISGDTGYGAHLKDTGKKHGPFDAAFIEIDGWNPGWPKTHLFPEDVIRAYQDVRAKSLIPVHWGVFDLALHPWDESITMLAALAKAGNVQLQTPLRGEKFIPGETQTHEWWKI
jgi:L-ascorbate metabolism protein UlaG (beta-lactamase superfamily)